MSLKPWVNELMSGKREGFFREMADFLNEIHDNDLNHEFYGAAIEEVEISVSEAYDLDRSEAIFVYAQDIVRGIIEDNDIHSWEYGLLRA